MATLSVLNYNNISSGLNMKVNNQNSNTNGGGIAGNSSLNKTFNKITVQNVLSENNGNSLNITNGNPNAIVRKIKDFGMIGSVNNASGAASLNMNPRKRPLTENKQNQKQPAENKLTASASKKPKLTKEERAAIRLAKKAAKENSSTTKGNAKDQAPLALLQQVKVPGTPGRKGLPLPQAVARRNARERNRVKQVNNGFAALREHIPEEVAEVFENQATNRGSCKKFSKVETLRMAVEYIRSLERLLGFDFPAGSGQHNSSSGEESFSLIKDEFDAYSPTMEEHFDDSLSHYDNEEFFSTNTTGQQQTQLPSASPPQPTQQMDMLPNITTLNGLQYIRIPGTNTYQLLTPDIFVGSATSPPSSTIDEEHFNALIDTNCVSPSSSSTPGIMQQQQTTTADQQSPSPPSINSTEVIRRVQETTAPVLTTTTVTNGENLNEGSATLSSSSSSSSTTTTTTSSSSSSSSSLLLSPVPQNQQQQMIPLLTASTSSPRTSPVLHQQQLHTLSPATTNDQHHQQQQQLQQAIRQTCAANQLQQQQQQQFLLPNSTDHQIGTLHMIKQEYPEEPSNNIYQQTSPSQQQHQQHLQVYHQHSAMSPPLERQTPTTSTASSSSHMLQQFFPHDQNSAAFYEGIVSMKKEFNEVLLDASHGTNVLSDESMIEAIDWWDAHTPKSDGGSLMM